MMYRLAICLTLIFCSPLSAQSMPVRSGEHDGFTRFTVGISKGASWSIEADDAQARLRVEGIDGRFDLSDAFKRIRRTRVANASQATAGAPLIFDLNCRCQVSSFLSGDSLIVIDFRDSAQAEDAGLNLPIRAPGGFAFQLPASRVPVSSDDVEPNRNEEAEAISLPLDLMRQPLPSRENENRYNRIENAAVSAMEQRLIEQITRAESQGLIESQSRAMASGAERQSEPTIRMIERKNADIPTVRNLAVTTSVDRDLAGLAADIATPSETTFCISTSQVNMQDWATDAPFSAQIGHWRAAVLGEFDRVDLDSVESLVRTYLYFGFGVEAQQALNLAEPPLKNQALYDVIAQILDGRQGTSINPFSGQQSCDTDAALWAVLSEPARMENINDDAIQRATSRLPPYVRELVGPRLALGFARAGRKDSAEGVLRSVDRIAEASAPELALAHASTAELRGEPDVAKEKRYEIATGDNEQSPTALIEAINMASRSKEAVPPDLVSLAQAYVTEFRNSEISEPLERALILATALNGDFGTAFEGLDEYASHADRDARDLRIGLLELMSERAADIEFLRQALKETAGVEDDLPETLSNDMAERFLELGFARPAQRLLSGASANPPSRERRILRAKAALAANLPREALVAVLGLSGPDVTELRAEAALQTRNHSQAASLFAESGRSDQAVRSSWLADTTSDEIKPPSEERYRQIFEQIGALSDASGTASEQTPLSRAETLVELSNSTRDGVRALLDAVSVD